MGLLQNPLSPRLQAGAFLYVAKGNSREYPADEPVIEQNTMTTDNKTALLNLIATLSFKLGDFPLASGKKSDYYIDCRITTLHAEGGRLSGLVLYDLIREHIPQAEAVGGLTMGADPLVSNIASASAWALADYNEILELSGELEIDDEDRSDEGPAPTLIH